MSTASTPPAASPAAASTAADPTAGNAAGDAAGGAASPTGQTPAVDSVLTPGPKASPYALRRSLPKGWLFRGHGLAALALAALSTLALVITLLGLLLLAGLMIDRGSVVVTPGQADRLAGVLGRSAPNSFNIGFEQPLLVRDAGILPQMVGSGDSLKNRWAGWLYRGVPGLRSTASAFPILIVLTLLAAIVWKLAELASWAQADRLAHQAGANLRQQLHRQALRLNPGDLDGRGRRDAEALFIGQVDRLIGAVRETVFHTARDLVRIVSLLLLLVLGDWFLALLVLVPLVGGYLLLEWERVHGAATQRLAESRGQRHLRALAEALNKSRLIRGYGLESFEQNQFTTHMGRLQKELSSGERERRWRERLLWSLAIAMGGLILWLVGSYILSHGRSFTAADGLYVLLVMGLIAVTMASARAVPAARRRVAQVTAQINAYLDRIPDVSQAVGAKFLAPVERHVDYEKVTYTTPAGTTLLENFELRLPAGSVTALVSIGQSERRAEPGGDGAADPIARPARDGQAALAAAMLLPRFLEPQSGRVLFDGEDIAWGTLESLREEVSFVGGRDPFFTGTVHENLDCGQNHKSMALIEAAKMCHVHKSILELPDGYETRLGEHGVSLPTGPAFLLGLARAAVRNPAVLIIAEPDEDLTEDFKALADDAYQRLRVGRTILFLPHRLSTMRKCDRIVLIKDGGVAAMGHQRDLVTKSELYRHWEYVTFNPIGRA